MSEDNSRRHHRGRGRPPGLRGRDIGMYYASKQRVKEEAHHHHQLPLVTIDPGQKHAIQRLLGHFQDQGSQPKESQRSGRPRFLDEYRRHLQANTHKEDMKQSNRDLHHTQGSSIVEDFSDLDEILLEKHRQMLKDQNYLRMLEFREKLPAFEKREALVNVIRSNRVVVISGETGCGKTTQVPQFILDDAVGRGEGGRTRIICTQPRRISAITIAERVADERGETCGGADASVGYQIRLESRVPRDRGSILYCTTGVVLQWMRTNKTLQGISHIILDEIHERDILSDFLITLLRDLVQAERKDLTVVLMSATLNAHQFSKYFFNCPTINIPGFTFPVKEFYLEDVLEVTKFRIESNRSIRSQQSMEKWRKYTVQGKAEMRKNKDFEDFIDPYLRDLANQRSYSTATIESLSHQESEEINFELIATLVRHIHQREDEGAILIFLPGWDDISKVFKLLTEDPRYRLSGSSVRIYPLHSLMPTIEQKAIFTRPPSGIRKIVIATNIAETSITIDDIVYVVDCGKIKMSNFDVESNLATLKPEWVSLANARQRRGRAGRVRPGICYHLYTRAREMILEQFVLPEILRTRLEEVILHIKSLELGLSNSFLAKLMNPPEEKAINLALELLRNINALYPSFENLTPLGYHLSRLPMDPQTGKMILFGAIFSCLDPVLTVASSLSFKDPFVIPLGKEELADRRKRFLSADTKSDHLMLVNVVTEWEEEVRHGRGSAYCWDNFLSESTLRMLSNMKRQFAEHLFEMKFLESKDVKDISSNRNSDNEALVRAVICAGLYPNVAQIRIRRNKRRGAFVNLSTRTERKVSIHPKSVNAKETDFRYPWMVYHQMMKSSSVFIHDCSMVSPLALIFFGKQVAWGHRDARYGGEEIIVDSFVKFGCGTGTGDLVQDLRLALDNYLEHKVTHPSSTNWRKGSRETDLLNAIIGLLTYELEAIEAENDEDEYY